MHIFIMKLIVTSHSEKQRKIFFFFTSFTPQLTFVKSYKIPSKKRKCYKFRSIFVKELSKNSRKIPQPSKNSSWHFTHDALTVYITDT